jgi:hypothetical protein
VVLYLLIIGSEIIMMKGYLLTHQLHRKRAESILIHLWVQMWTLVLNRGRTGAGGNIHNQAAPGKVWLVILLLILHGIPKELSLLSSLEGSNLILTADYSCPRVWTYHHW